MSAAEPIEKERFNKIQEEKADGKEESDQSKIEDIAIEIP